MNNLNEICFTNEFVDHFKGDQSEDKTPRPTIGVLYSRAIPTPVRSPYLIGWSENIAKELGLNKPSQEKDIDILAGNYITSSMKPYAACYAGHQFGHWAGQLGDGRAITLGEIKTNDGNSWELQLKGAGLTPYSRRADGRAVLRSSVREFLMSEAMYHLGVPTTRALSLVNTGDLVLRDKLYDGNAAYEPGAIVMRVAPSFLRFGNYEILAARKEMDNLRALVDWTIQKHYPHIEGPDSIINWFKEIVDRTAYLIVEWMRVGFVHGVMNTDNMSILGLTIDYGPFSFLDAYDPNYTPNTTDLPGRRYAFGKQAAIGKWNLACLAGAIAPLFEDTENITNALEQYDDIYWNKYYHMMGNKIGLEELYHQDIDLINDLEKVLTHIKPDMTHFFQILIESLKDKDREINTNYFTQCFYDRPDEAGIIIFDSWLEKYAERIKRNKRSISETQNKMRQVNPRFILRNYYLQQAIESLEKGDSTVFDSLQKLLLDPYNITNTKENGRYFERLPFEYYKTTGSSSQLSCSS